MQGNVVAVRTDPVTQFTEALVTNASETENIRLPGAIAAGGHCRSVLRHLVVASMEQRAWEVALFARRSFQTAPIEQSAFLASYRFTAAEGKQFGSGAFYFQAPDILLPYYDYDFEDQTLPPDQRGGVLHLMLLNRSVDPKSAGAAGAVQITCHLEPTYG